MLIPVYVLQHCSAMSIDGVKTNTNNIAGTEDPNIVAISSELTLSQVFSEL
jgi:hypothetical protein